MKAVEIKPDIYWVGVIDWGARDFHGYVTPMERHTTITLSWTNRLPCLTLLSMIFPI